MTNPSADDARPATAGRAPAPDPGQPGPAPQAPQDPQDPRDPAETAAVEAEVAATRAEAAASDAEMAAAQAETAFARAPAPAAAHGDEPLLRLVGVGKNFGPVRALTDINLDVPVGLVTALVGDNGAGKSTLIKTIAGIWTQDSGEILWEGKPVRLHSPKDATDLGIATVYQDLALADNLDIVQNMFLGREPVRHWVLDETTMEKDAKRTLADLFRSTARATPPVSASRRSIRTWRWRTISTSCRTCSSAGSACETASFTRTTWSGPLPRRSPRSPCGRSSPSASPSPASPVASANRSPSPRQCCGTAAW